MGISPLSGVNPVFERQENESALNAILSCFLLKILFTQNRWKDEDQIRWAAEPGQTSFWKLHSTSSVERFSMFCYVHSVLDLSVKDIVFGACVLQLKSWLRVRGLPVRFQAAYSSRHTGSRHPRTGLKVGRNQTNLSGVCWYNII